MFFFHRMGRRFVYFMSQRNGVDHLNIALIWSSLALQVLILKFQAPPLILINYAIYGWLLFRFFSQNKKKRREENRKFIEWHENLRLSIH